MRVVEDRPVLHRVLAGRLVPDGIGTGFEIYRAAGKFAAGKDIRDASGFPMVRIGWLMP